MDDDVLGPIDYLAVEWPGGLVTGEGFQLLLDLGRGIVRVLDLEFVAKAADGTVRKAQGSRCADRGRVRDTESPHPQRLTAAVAGRGGLKRVECLANQAG